MRSVGAFLWFSALAIVVLARASRPVRADIERNIRAQTAISDREENVGRGFTWKHGSDEDDNVWTRRKLEERYALSGNVRRRTNNATEADLDMCPGYDATDVKTTSYSLTAELTLAGLPCNVYGPDLTSLILTVTYETSA
jgi:hypothetical protein